MKSHIKTAFAVLLVCCLHATSVTAQTSPLRVLSDSDMKRFAATLKPMAAEFEALGERYDADAEVGNDLNTLIDAMKADSEVRKIVGKYGWDDDFYAKYGAVIAGWVTITMESVGAELEAELEKAREEIEADPDLTRAQKDELMSRYTMKDLYDVQAGNPFYDGIHPDDLKLVRKYWKEISDVFESL